VPRERKQEGKIKSRQAAESDVAEGLSESATGGGFGVGKEPAGPFFAAQMRERWALRETEALAGAGQGRRHWAENQHLKRRLGEERRGGLSTRHELRGTSSRPGLGCSTGMEHDQSLGSVREEVRRERETDRDRGRDRRPSHL
jgi:hypothetical protein